MTCSRFLLRLVQERHLGAWEQKMPQLVAELCKNTNVDDLLSGGVTVQEAQYRKESKMPLKYSMTLVSPYTSCIPKS